MSAMHPVVDNADPETRAKLVEILKTMSPPIGLGVVAEAIEEAYFPMIAEEVGCLPEEVDFQMAVSIPNGRTVARTLN